MKKFTQKIRDNFKEIRLATPAGDWSKLTYWDKLLDDDEDFAEEFHRVFDNIDVPEVDNTFDPNYFDHYMHIELIVYCGGDYLECDKVTKRLKDHCGNPIGPSHRSPIMGSRIY